MADQQRIVRLNVLVSMSTDVMPHDLAVATGCSYIESLALLMHLVDKSLAIAYLNVYLAEDPDMPILVRKAAEGYLTMPYYDEEHDVTITDPGDVIYAFRFQLTAGIRFTNDSDPA